MTLGKSLDLSEPLFSHLYIENNETYFLDICTCGSKGWGWDTGEERAENSIPLRVSRVHVLVIPLYQLRLRGAVPELQELMWGKCRGRDSHQRLPRLLLFCPCYWPGRCLLLRGERGSPVPKGQVGPGPWVPMTITTTAVIVHTDGAGTPCSCYPHNSPTRQPVGECGSWSPVSSRWGAGLWTPNDAEVCLLGMRPGRDQGWGLGAPEVTSKEAWAEVRAWVGADRVASTPGGCAAETPGCVWMPFAASVPRSGDWRGILTLSISPPGSLRLGCIPEPEVGAWGWPGWCSRQPSHRLLCFSFKGSCTSCQQACRVPLWRVGWSTR